VQNLEFVLLAVRIKNNQADLTEISFEGRFLMLKPRD
jgi:hypothetical protein